jgi:CBS domain-containing protein
VLPTRIHRSAPLRRCGIGATPICGEDDGLKGVLTDRDIVVKAVAQGRDPATTRVGDLAQRSLVWISADASFQEALSLMTEHAVKRLPVMDANKRLCGIITEADRCGSSAGPRVAARLSR